LPEVVTITPLKNPGLSDFHCHCDFSADAKGAIDAYCEAALRRGLAEICFVTHYDNTPDATHIDAFIVIEGLNQKINVNNVSEYVKAVERVATKYRSRGLNIHLGIEISWWPGCVDDVVMLKKLYDFEYVLCGLHEIDHKCFVSPRIGEYFEGWTVRQLVNEYFRSATAAVETGLFDGFAHLGYYLRHGVKHYGADMYNYDISIVGKFFQSLTSNNTVLEINTGGMRHGLNHFYPDNTLIKAAKSAGVTIRHLGSDAHVPENVGFDFDNAVKLLTHVQTAVKP
jgi:histidinol-phosphatase (PHP family)